MLARFLHVGYGSFRTSAHSTAVHVLAMRLSRQTAAESLFLALAPVATFFALHICLINQGPGSVDPWFYTGYGQEFKALQQYFGWTYYVLRFPAILPYLAVPKSWDPVTGFAIFRYLIVLLSGVPLYLWARHHFGVASAVAGYLFLFCDPLFPRLLLWDLTPFVSVPMALAGMALWQLPFKRQGLGKGLAGFAFCASVTSHAFTGTAIAVFFFVEAVRRLLRREWSQLLLLDIVAPLIGAGVCLSIGLGCYYLIIGPFDPRVFISVTLDAIRAGDQYSQSHSAEIGTWLRQSTNVLVPPVLVGFVAIGFAGELIKDTIVARVWWFSFLYCAGYAVYQFVFDRFVLEEVVYFFHLTLVVYLLFPACLFLITRQLSGKAQTLAIGGAVGVLIMCPLFRAEFPLPYSAAMQFGTGAKAPLAAGLAFVIAAIYLSRRPLKLVAFASLYSMALTGAIQYAAITAAGFGSIFSNPTEAGELDLYRAGVQMVRIFGRYANPRHRIMLWYSAKDWSAMSLASTALLYSMNRPYQGDGLPNVGEYETARLRSPDLTYILLLSQDRGAIEAGKKALLDRGYKLVDVDEQTIGGASFKAGVDLVELMPDPNFAKAIANARSLSLSNLTGSEQRSPELVLHTPLRSWFGTARMSLDASCISGGGWVSIELYVVRGKVDVSVLDRRGDGVVAATSAVASPNVQNIVLPINSLSSTGDLVLRNADKTSAAEGILQTVQIAARGGVPADCHVMPAKEKVPAPP